MPKATLDPSRASLDELLDALEMWGQKLGLDRIRTLLEELSSPQLQVPCVLVGGTNGKGSVTTLLARMARRAGCRTGAYYSPHLESVHERIRVDGRTISTDMLRQHLRELFSSCRSSGRELPTYFEALTASAFLEFRRTRCDLAVLEVGLGGRLDATNVSEPLLSVITSIALDHTEHLGTTLRQIAHEKAGILREGRVALVSSGGVEEVHRALEHEAHARGAHYEDVWRTVTVRVQEDESGEELAESSEQISDHVLTRSGVGGGPVASTALAIETPKRSYRVRTGLLGTHQHANLGLAVRAAEWLAELGFASIDETAIVKGGEHARWPGRLEQVWLADGLLVLLDGAHNPAGGRALAEYLAHRGADQRDARSPSTHTVAQPQRVDLLFGTLAGKNAKETLAALAPWVRRLVLTEPEGGPRTLSVNALEAETRSVDWPALQAPLQVRSDWRDALTVALDGARQSEPGCLVVAGSLYLVGAVRAALRERFGVPPATTDLVL